MVGTRSAREERALARCRRALERGRPVRGRRLAAGDEGLLLDLRGVLGHVPASDANERPPTRGVLGPVRDRWEGWVVAVGDDLVHLCARRPGDRGEEVLRRGEVVSAGTSGARVRVEGETSLAVLPWEELSWHPQLEPPSLEPGTEVAGRVVGLTLGGPVLSPRSATPSPWPAIALALPPGTTVPARIEACVDGRALVRTDTNTAPTARAIVSKDRLPPGAGPGTALEVTVARVNAAAGALELDGVTPASRAPRPGPAARRPGRPEPGQAA